MKFAGHSYNNDVFDSLLDGLKDDVVVKKQEKKASAPVSGMDVFSSQTSADLDAVQMDQMKTLIAEFDYAAKNAKVAYTQDDFVKFANDAKGLRGKELERAAKKFCANLQRATSDPQGTTRYTTDLNALSSHRVVPASSTENIAGRNMGSLKNPNSIWDSDALTRVAQTETPDERIAGERMTKEAAVAKEKEQRWFDLAQQGKDVISKGITPTKAASASESTHNPKLGKSHMSMFDSDRDFSQVPEKDSGQQIKEAADQRASKKADQKADWDHSNPAQNTRSAIDKLFEGWLKE